MTGRAQKENWPAGVGVPKSAAPLSDQTRILRVIAGSASARGIEDALAAGADPFAVDKDGMDALMRAVVSENEAVVRILAPISDARRVVGQERMTPLLLAIEMANVELARILAPWSDVDHADARGKTAVLIALREAPFDKKMDLLDVLVPCSPVTPEVWVEIAFAAAQTNRVDWLARAQAHCDLRVARASGLPHVWEGGSLLAAAAEVGSVEAIRWLLAAGHESAPLETGSRASTPLIKAADDDAWCPMGATKERRKQSAQTLIQAGCEVNAADWAGCTALMKAARGNAELTRIFLAAGADANAQDQEGATALHWAVESHERKEAAQCVQILAQHSNPDMENNDGLTAAQLALEKGRFELADAIWGAMSPARATKAFMASFGAQFPATARLMEAHALEQEAAVGRVVAVARGLGGDGGDTGAVAWERKSRL